MAKKEALNIMIIGSGGREHALGWKLKQSPRCKKIFFAPGNGGTSEIGENIAITVDKVDTKTVDEIDYFARHNDVSMIVIGPEDPLAGGLADRLKKEGRYIFGPGAEAARLEADKAWAKHLMLAARVPTAASKTFTDHLSAREYVENHETPVVVKAAGLAKGKGAIVCDGPEDAALAVDACMKSKDFGPAGETIVVEERLVGEEASILALCDGQNIFVLDPCQDHKRIGEGDTGLNTGGMGAYCPAPIVGEKQMDETQREVLVPIVDALRRSDIEYKGVLYAGLMLTAGGIKNLEFNVRFGDPETQPLMMRLKGDLVEIMTACCEGTLDEVDLSWDKRVCCCVVMAAGGYPQQYKKGDVITGIAEAEKDKDVKVFHAGTSKNKAGQLVTNGGRVLGVCALADTLDQAREKANSACEKINFAGAYFRRDIGSVQKSKNI